MTRIYVKKEVNHS